MFIATYIISWFFIFFILLFSTFRPEVISCLSGIVTNDTVFEKTQRVSKDCRQQLKFELFERVSNILVAFKQIFLQCFH